MAMVKGTKQHRVKVIHYRPWLWFFLVVTPVIVALGSVWYAQKQGYAAGLEKGEKAIQKAATLDQLLAESEAYAAELEQRLANINLGAEVDRQATEDIRQEVIALKAQIAALDEENNFYRGLMTPSGNKRGLTIGTVELSQTERPRIFSYKVVMQQLATNHQLLHGYLEYKILGRENGADVVYDLSQVSEEVDEARIKLRFKYFQSIEGELELPVGFDPLAIELVATSTGKNPVTVEKRFGWLVEELL